MDFKEWWDDEKDLEYGPAGKCAAKWAWEEALSSAAVEVNKIAMHHNTIVCAVNSINKLRGRSPVTFNNKSI